MQSNNTPKFVKSANFEIDWIHDPKPEICFLGRSNVGKSTTINAVANSNICKTSKTPGRTQLINFFDFGSYRLVDLPGYGFAKVPKYQLENISQMIFNYISKRKNLVAVFQICDIEVITEKDNEVAHFLKTNFEKHFILLNKADKVSSSYFENNKHKIAQKLNVTPDQLIPISAKTKKNIDKVKNIIKNLVSEKNKNGQEI